MTNEEYCKQLERRVAELEKENAELRAQLGISDTKTTAVEPLQDTNQTAHIKGRRFL